MEPFRQAAEGAALSAQHEPRLWIVIVVAALFGTVAAMLMHELMKGFGE